MGNHPSSEKFIFFKFDETDPFVESKNNENSDEVRPSICCTGNFMTNEGDLLTEENLFLNNKIIRKNSFQSPSKEPKKHKISSSQNSPANMFRRRQNNGSDSDEYGWFEDFESSIARNEDDDDNDNPLKRAFTLQVPISEPPAYVLESSLSYQQLWYETAGKRPKQPERERKYFENIWKSNFENSSVEYKENLVNNSSNSSKNVSIKSSTQEENSKEKENEKGNGKGNEKGKDQFDLSHLLTSRNEIDIIYRGKSPFSNSVSKAFVDNHITIMTLQVIFIKYHNFMEFIS